MKKVISILLILFISSLLFAESPGPHSSQTIAGFINHTGSDYMKLTVSYDVTSTDGTYSGINLDLSDSSNSIRYLIAPSATELGLRIGSFDLEATHRHYIMRIYHSKLINTENSTQTIDYKLSISYSITGGVSSSASCFSTSSLVSPDEMIHVTLSSSSGVILIQNGGFYFRLKDASEVRYKGQYKSTVYIEVGTE